MANSLFAAVLQAFSDMQAAENDWESKTAANATAQAALANATTTAAQATSDLSAATTALAAKVDALTAADAAFKASLTNGPAPPAS